MNLMVAVLSAALTKHATAATVGRQGLIKQNAVHIKSQRCAAFATRHQNI